MRTTVIALSHSRTRFPIPQSFPHSESVTLRNADKRVRKARDCG